MRALLLGKGILAIHAGEQLHCHGWSVDVCPVMPEPDWTDSLHDWAFLMNLPIFAPGIASGNYELALSVFYDRIFTQEFIRAHSSVLNFHNAPLPSYRGVNPINWALKNGERQHGVTLHEVTPGIDCGPILAQRRFPIDPAVDEVEDVYLRCIAAGLELLTDSLGQLDRLPRIPQDETQAFGYSKRDADRLGDRAGWRRP